MEEENKKRRIGNMQGALMISVALTIDGVQFLLNFIPFLGWIFVSLMSVFAWLTFFTWYKFNGISFLKGKTALLRLTALSAGGIIEIIPIINALPAWTLAVGIMFITVMLEDQAQKMGIGKLLKKNTNKNARIRRNKQISIA